MKKLLSKILWFLLGLIWLFIGINWAMTNEFEPIHSKMVEKPWEEVPAQYQEVLLFLMRVCCGMCLGIGATTMFLLFGPLSKIWCCANVYLFILNVISLTPLVLINLKMRFLRDPPIMEPNWALASLSLAFAVGGFVLGFDPCTEGKCPCVGSGKCGCKGEKKE